MKVYFISGLGANEKAFGFLDLSFCEPVFVKWIAPLAKESLASYALRLRAGIREANPIVAGVSFGGMLVTEMAKADPGLRGIIISSNKSSAEFPYYLRIWKNFPVYKWVPGSVIKLTGRLTKNWVGPVGKAQRETFTSILNDTDPKFTAWAVDAILHWKNKEIPKNIVHIHGSADTLLPLRLVNAHHVIQKGRHLMIMDDAPEISQLLKKIILDGTVN